MIMVYQILGLELPRENQIEALRRGPLVGLEDVTTVEGKAGGCCQQHGRGRLLHILSFKKVGGP